MAPSAAPTVSFPSSEGTPPISVRTRENTPSNESDNGPLTQQSSVISVEEGIANNGTYQTNGSSSNENTDVLVALDYKVNWLILLLQGNKLLMRYTTFYLISDSH